MPDVWAGGTDGQVVLNRSTTLLIGSSVMGNVSISINHRPITN